MVLSPESGADGVVGAGRQRIVVGVAVAVAAVVAAFAAVGPDAGPAAGAPRALDSFLQQGDKLAPGSESGPIGFGWSVALSADGRTALVGGPSYSAQKGAAWVFTRSGNTWSQEGGKLAPKDPNGSTDFGYGVALSADGNTALVGGIYDDNANHTGAAWVFTRSGGSWSQQGSKLTGSNEVGGGTFGWSVALSADGDTAAVGGPNDNDQGGAVWFFGRSGTTWGQLGPKITGTGEVGGGRFGTAVTLSGDGKTAVVGAPYNAGSAGAVWIYGRQPPGRPPWALESGPVTGSDLSGAAEFGTSAALSDDGSTALVGGPQDAVGKGAAWVFTHPPSGWAQQGGKLVESAEIGGADLGSGVSLSSDGRTALIAGFDDDGGKGAAWILARSGGSWSAPGSKLVGGGEKGMGGLGSSAALSAAGDVALLGASGDDGDRGAAWVFANAPVVGSIAPSSGPTDGGTQVAITGSDLGRTSAVQFGSSAAASFRVVSSTEVDAVSPRGQAGAVDVTVVTSAGTSSTGAPDRFTYVVPPQPTSPAPPAATRDAVAPTAPRAFAGRVAGGALVLSWKPAGDNVGVDHYRLVRDGKGVKRLARGATRVSMPGFRPKRRDRVRPPRLRCRRQRGPAVGACRSRRGTSTEGHPEGAARLGSEAPGLAAGREARQATDDAGAAPRLVRTLAGMAAASRQDRPLNAIATSSSSPSRFGSSRLEMRRRTRLPTPGRARRALRLAATGRGLESRRRRDTRLSTVATRKTDHVNGREPRNRSRRVSGRESTSS